jgi:hypothetical protein
MTQMTLQAVRQLIANDSYAITFQSIEQYRATLLRHFDSLADAQSDSLIIQFDAMAGAPAAVHDLLAERARQLTHGWTPGNDDMMHTKGEMATAAGLYALYAHDPVNASKEYAPPHWPWHPTWWKPTTPRRNLEKAGGLILAEMERLDRAAQPEKRGA